jgi:hypothetical protein
MHLPTMGYDDYEYLARHVRGRDRPVELWRQLGERMEYLSLVDWEWHDHPELAFRPHPDTVTPVTPTEAAALERDRQGFVRYFVEYTTPRRADRFPPAPSDVPTLVYRHRRLPTVSEVFDSGNVWGSTRTVSQYLRLDPDGPPNLREVDRDTAERTIQQLHGVTGATDLGIIDT